MSKVRIHLTPTEAESKGWRCRTHLRKENLMPAPGARPAGSVWQGRGVYFVYDRSQCVPWVREPGDAQLRRQAISRQATDLITGDCLVLDVETTGTGRDDEVCEIAIVDAAGQVLLDTLVRPSREIPVEASFVNGISNAMVATAPTWPEVAERYASIVEGRRVVAYNATFDSRLIRQTHQAYGLSAPVLDTDCLMLMYAVWNGEWDKRRESWRWCKLIEAAGESGVANPDGHRALADAVMTLGVLRYLQARSNGRRSPRKSR